MTTSSSLAIIAALSLTGDDMDYVWKLSDLKTVIPNGRKVFSCFSCGGGSSMGYKRAGYEVIGNCEIDEKINQMYVKNFHPRYNYRMSIEDLPKLEEFPEEMLDLDILDGSPPCSTFSMAGKREADWGRKKKFREGQAEQVLSDLFFDYINVAKRLQPKVVVAENVKGLILGAAKGYMNLILKKYDEAGYVCQVFLLNSATMGVPQTRERVFIIARRKDLNYPRLKLEFNEAPIPYGVFAEKEGKPINPASTLYRRWTRRSNEDNSVGDTVLRTENGKISSFTSPYIKRNEVCNTLTSGGQYVRFDIPATISERDMKCIQTFPQDYDFNGNDVQYVCGMSVPPIMMEKIARAIYEQWLKVETP